MDYDLRFQLLPSDVTKIHRATKPWYYRSLSFFSCVFTFLLSLSDIFQGENLVLNAFLMLTISMALLCMWWPLIPFSTIRNTDRSVKLDGQNLTSSLGTKSYDIPWPYFLQHGSLLEEGDHFYFKSNLGNIYLPKRAFEDDNDINKFRADLSHALGDRCLLVGESKRGGRVITM